MAAVEGENDLPNGHLCGTLPNGTPVYSNSEKYDEEDKKSGKKIDFFTANIHEGFKTGVSSQCVELARRAAWDYKKLFLPDVHIAHQILHIPHMYTFDEKLNEWKKVRVERFYNGASTQKPVKECFLIWRSTLSNFAGHIAWIIDVDDKFVYVADQNRYMHDWEGKHYSSKFPLKYSEKNKTWTIEDDDEPVLGWVTFPDSPNLPLPAASPSSASPISPSANAAATAASGGNDSSSSSPLLQQNNYFASSPKKRSRDSHPTLRPVPKGIAGKFPRYDTSLFIELKAWGRVMLEFHPHMFVFPFYFIYMITRFMVVRPISMWVGSFFSSSSSSSSSSEGENESKKK